MGRTVTWENLPVTGLDLTVENLMIDSPLPLILQTKSEGGSSIRYVANLQERLLLVGLAHDPSAGYEVSAALGKTLQHLQLREIIETEERGVGYAVTRGPCFEATTIIGVKRWFGNRYKPLEPTTPSEQYHHNL